MHEAGEASAVNYVLTLDEINTLTREGGKPAETLMNVVALIARRFHTDVCSAYLLEPDRANLVLAATLGLRRECIGTLRMALHEGLAGMVAEQVRPVAVEEVRKHPRFKFFGEAGEEGYHSFLGVPLIDCGVLQGVLVVQTIEPRSFADDEVRMLCEAAAQVAPVVSEARTLDRFIAPAQERLWALARNLWWCWDADTTSLFRELDPVRWRALKSNPISLLSEIPLEALEKRAAERNLHSRINYAYRRLQEYLKADRTWGATHAGVLRPRPVAYFSAEFGLHQSVPIYSGGLGVLAGDHIKSASDLDIPLVGIGLFYGQGYFRQRLDSGGWQQEDYIQVNVAEMPMEPAIGPKGEPVTVQIETRRGTIFAKVWRMKVGRCDLLLLDTDVDGNAPEDRELTSRLYGGDGRVRIRQELLLGIGGYRALRAMGITPGVLHMNEGHSGFAVLEAIRCRMEDEGLNFDSASRRVAREVAFTTHTPVPAGHDRFDAGLMEEHLGPLRESLGLSAGPADGAGPREPRQSARDVLHDGTGPQAFAARECRVRAARRGLARNVDGPVPRPRRGCRAHRPHHQRGSRAFLAGPADVPPLRPPPGHRLAQVQRRIAHLGRHRKHRRRRAVGDPPEPEGAPARIRAATRGGAGRASRRIAGEAAAAQPRAFAGCPDHRVCAALRDLQTRQPGARATSSSWRRWSTTPSVRCSSSSPAKPIRSTSPASACCRKWR